MTRLARKLKEQRLKLNLTQNDVARELGYTSSQFISNLERGTTSLPVRKLSEAAEVFNLPLEVLVKAKVDDYRDRVWDVLGA